MFRRQMGQHRARACVLLALSLVFAIPAAAQETPPQDSAVENPLATPAPDLYTLPEGGVQQLVKFIERLESFRPTSAQELLEYRSKAPAAIEAAANRILELDSDPQSAASKKAISILLLGEARRIASFSVERQRDLLARVAAHLSGKELGEEDLPLAMLVTRGLEPGADKKLAAEACETLGKLFAASSNPRFNAFGNGMLGSARRLNLTGNLLELKGTRLDGTKFDIAELKGQVVLVDFWATWCAPCRAEVPNIREQYDKYHDRGFEVVGISLDQDRQAVEQYVAEQKTPWITLHEKQLGGRHPATAYYGILSIPTMFLVGRDGKVLSTHARGEELERLLKEQFADSQPADGADS